MAKAYTDEQKQAFLKDFYEKGKPLKDWCADKNPTTPKPSLAKMQEWLNPKPVKEKQPTRKQLLQRIAELEAEIAGMTRVLGAQAGKVAV